MSSLERRSGSHPASPGPPLPPRDLQEEALTLFRALGDERAAASALDRLAQHLYALGDGDQARQLHEEALAIRRKLGDAWGLGWSLAHLGDLATDGGDYAAARAHYAECFAVIRRLGTRPISAKALEGFAALAAVTEPARAQRLLGAAAALHESSGAGAPRDDRQRVSRLTERIQQQLAPYTAAAAWDAGRAMTLEEAIAYALEGTEPVHA